MGGGFFPVGASHFIFRLNRWAELYTENNNENNENHRKIETKRGANDDPRIIPPACERLFFWVS